MLSSARYVLNTHFNSILLDVDSVNPSGPWGAPNGRRWITRDDVLELAMRTPRSIPHVNVALDDTGACSRTWMFCDDHLFPRWAFDLTSVDLRGYQADAMNCVVHPRHVQSGLIVMDCGAGKTYVGLGIMRALKIQTVIVTTHFISAQQWKQVIVQHGVPLQQILVLGEDEGYVYEYPWTKSVIICTYVMFSRCVANLSESTHHRTLCKAMLSIDEVGLLLLDEVHSAPAKTFSSVCRVRARVIIGLTATLCREDNGIQLLHKHIGPVLHHVKTSFLEEHNYIAKMHHYDVIVPFSTRCREEYDNASKTTKHSVAATNALKIDVLELLIRKHGTSHILVFCDIIDALHNVCDIIKSRNINVIGPITGHTEKSVRVALFRHFEASTSCCLFLSKVGDNAVNLPHADVVIKVSTTSRSRTQEYQRNGRGSRVTDGALKDTYIYTLITKDSCEEEFYQHRQQHLTSNGTRLERVELKVIDDKIESNVLLA